MPVELSASLTGWESVRDTLAQIRESHGALGTFFTDMCTELDQLSATVVTRSHAWQTERRRVESEIDGSRATLEEERTTLVAARSEFDELSRKFDATVAAERESRTQQTLDMAGQGNDLESLQQQQAHDAAKQAQVRAAVQEDYVAMRRTQEEIGTHVERLAAVAARLSESQPASNDSESKGMEEEQFRQLLDQIEQERDALRTAQDQSRSQAEQLMGMASELTQTRESLAQAREDITRRQKELERDGATDRATAEADEGLHGRLHELEQKRNLLEQERASLEGELELVRNRAAEMAELLAEQKSAATQQQNQWADELKRMRCLLEGMALRLADTDAARVAPAPELSAAHVSGENLAAGETEGDEGVLQSVMAQFEMLQRDIAKRRATQS